MKILSEATFRSLAGDDVYARGLVYYNEGRVGELSLNNGRVTAEVAGTRQYSVVLTHTAKQFEGYCTCPASDRFDFCKHCVAVALSYYYQTQTNQELQEQSPDHRLRNYLNTLTKPALVNELFALIEQNQSVHDHWQLKAEIASGSLSAPEVRKRITKAIPYKPGGIWRYREVSDYFAHCEQALSLLDGPIQTLPPQDIFKLVVYASQRLEKALQTIDDSGGFRFETVERLQSWLSSALAQESWDATDKAKNLLSLITDDALDHDVLDPESVAETSLPEEAKTAFYAVIEKSFEELWPDPDQYSEGYQRYSRLERILLNRAHELNNIDKEFAIREKGAVTVGKCLELVDLCIQHQRIDDAARWLKHASELESVGHFQQYDIETAQIKLWIAQGQIQKGLNAQWARFEENEDMETLNETLTTATMLQKKEEIVSEAIKSISEKLTNDRSSLKNRSRAETLIEIHLQHGRLDDAYKVAKQYQVRVDLLVQIVQATDTFKDTTHALIKRIVNHLVRIGNNNSYKQAVQFLAKQGERIDDAEQTSYDQLVLDIYNEPANKRKPNFVEQLKLTFPQMFESK